MWTFFADSEWPKLKPIFGMVCRDLGVDLSAKSSADAIVPSYHGLFVDSIFVTVAKNWESRLRTDELGVADAAAVLWKLFCSRHLHPLLN